MLVLCMMPFLTSRLLLVGKASNLKSCSLLWSHVDSAEAVVVVVWAFMLWGLISSAPGKHSIHSGQ